MYELPETIADCTSLEPCGRKWLTLYENDGTRKLVTSEEDGDHASWLACAARYANNPYDGLIASETKGKSNG